MNETLIAEILMKAGIFTKEYEALNPKDKVVLQWLAENLSTTEILSIEYSDNPIQVYSQWLSQYRESEISAPKVEEEVSINDSGQSFPLTKDSDIEIEGFSKNVLYPRGTPNTHELIPQSFFGLPIFSTSKAGTSFEKIDRDSMRVIYDSLESRLLEPELLGVTLDPQIDSLVFRSILSKLRSAPLEDFEEREGKRVVEGTLHKVDYRDLLDVGLYSENTIRSKQFIATVDRACKRISQFKLSYKTLEKNEKIAKYVNFFSHLEFNMSSLQIEFVGTTVIPKLFRDDAILSLNPQTINNASGSLENTLLYYLTSLPRGFAKTPRQVPLTSDVPIMILLARCYPNIDLSKLETDYPRIDRVKSAMRSLQDKGLIKFDLVGRGAKCVFKRVFHYCEMSDVEFKEFYDVVGNPKTQTGNSLAHYLQSLTVPRRVSEQEKLSFGEKLCTNAFSLIKFGNDAELIESFKGVYAPKVGLLTKYAELVGHSELLSVLNQISSLRSSK